MTATAKLAFENMSVPKENILGPLGKGLKVALTVLDSVSTLVYLGKGGRELNPIAQWMIDTGPLFFVLASPRLGPDSWRVTCSSKQCPRKTPDILSPSNQLLVHNYMS